MTLNELIDELISKAEAGFGEFDVVDSEDLPINCIMIHHKKKQVELTTDENV